MLYIPICANKNGNLCCPAVDVTVCLPVFIPVLFDLSLVFS